MASKILKTRKSPISGAEMIIPSTDLGRAVHEAACCVMQIRDFENHCAAFNIQQDLLELLELEGVASVVAYVQEEANTIDEVFSPGKAEKLLKLLAA